MTVTKAHHYLEAVGRRKTAIARVRLTTDHKGLFMINNRPFDEYFKTEAQQVVARQPLVATAMEKHFSISAKIVGGGIQAQAAALAHGLARALLLKDEALKAPLRAEGLLTRDSRAKERRKFGLKKARKSPQWSKR